MPAVVSRLRDSLGPASASDEPPDAPRPPYAPPDEARATNESVASTCPVDHSPDASLPPVLTADELARLLRINRKTVYTGFKSGEIPGGKRIGGTIRFSRDAVLRWLAEGQVSRSSRGLR